MWKPSNSKQRKIALWAVWIITIFLSTIVKANFESIYEVFYKSLTYLALALTVYFSIAKSSSWNYELEKQKKYILKMRRRGIDAYTGDICCKRCGSTQLKAHRRGYSSLDGYMGAADIYITCLRCGKRRRA